MIVFFSFQFFPPHYSFYISVFHTSCFLYETWRWSMLICYVPVGVELAGIGDCLISILTLQLCVSHFSLPSLLVPTHILFIKCRQTSISLVSPFWKLTGYSAILLVETLFGDFKCPILLPIMASYGERSRGLEYIWRIKLPGLYALVILWSCIRNY